MLDVRDLTNIDKSTPIEPYIDCDGGYFARCHRCWHEIDPHNNICPYCHQMQDWTWLNKNNNK